MSRSHRSKDGPQDAVSATGTAAGATSLRRLLHEAERQEILKALEQAGWVVAGPRGAAARLGMKRSTLQFRMRRLGILRTSGQDRKRLELPGTYAED